MQQSEELNLVILEKIKKAKSENVTELDLSDLGLETLPEELFDLQSLQILDLRRNSLKKIPKEIQKLENLTEINLSYNKIASLPREFGNLKSLKEVLLVNCKFRNFPSSLLKIPELELINMARNKIGVIPEAVNDLSKLSALWLHSNPLRILPLTTQSLKKINRLSISKTNITNTSFFEHLDSIRSLAVSGENGNILESVFERTGVKRLILINFNNVSLRNLEKLGQLENLHIHESFVYDLESIGELSNLSELDIYTCINFRLTDNLKKLIKLKSVSITYSDLLELPEGIKYLKSLENLDLNSNSIQSLPAEIGELENLESLNLSYNSLTTIPTELSKLEKLKQFSISGNRETIVSPPQAVVTQGKEAILRYLKDLSQNENVWASRMVMVGEGGVGKSCLLDSLLNNPFSAGSNTTHGINIAELQLDHPVYNTKMNLKVWDFGGQDIYHATHQFYLTNHSLFILVWSARLGFEAGKVYKWLEVITALAPDSPILIVATNSDPRGADLPKGDLEKQFGNKISFFEVDNETRTGIDILQTAIVEKATKLKYMGVELPRSWINSIEEIKKLYQKHISKENIESVFSRNGVSKELFEPFLHYLHDLGAILYFPDEETLKDVVILNPSWISKQIAKILDSSEISKNSGFLTKDIVQEIWSDLSPDMREKLITLMEKFDLSYKTKDNKNISLIVEKLKFEEPPEYENTWKSFNYLKEISFKYQLDIIPPGIPTWFIARTHRFSTKIHWRYGVILQDENNSNSGLVLTSPERKEVWLKVRGETPFYFFAQLRDTLELTFKRFEGLKINTLVPCPGHNGKPCSHFFDLKQLEKRLSQNKPKTSIECPESTENVDVLQLLFGLSFAPDNNFLVEQITNQIEKAIRKELISNVEEMKKFLELEFIKSYKVQQQIMDITCPNSFILSKIKLEFLDKDLALNHYNLHLCCQMPGHGHIVGEPYVIKIPKHWLKVIGPYYNKMIGYLKISLPIISSGLKSLVEKIEYDETSPKLDLFKELSKAMPSFEKSLPIDEDAANFSNEDFSIRLIRRILDEADDSHTWRGLERTVSPEGHIIWLCPEHSKEYKV